MAGLGGPGRALVAVLAGAFGFSARRVRRIEATTQHLSRVRVVCAEALWRRDSDRLPRSRRSCCKPVGEEPGWQGGAKLPESSLFGRGRRLEDRVRSDSNLHSRPLSPPAIRYGGEYRARPP